MIITVIQDIQQMYVLYPFDTYCCHMGTASCARLD